MCLFLILEYKERFKPVTMELINNYLLGKQEYLTNVLQQKGS